MALTKVGKEGITGIDNSSDATAITIDSSENVGIGLTTPTAPLTVKAPSGAEAVHIHDQLLPSYWTVHQCNVRFHK